MLKDIRVCALSLLIAALACSNQVQSPPTPIPSGILVDEIPGHMDIIFDSIRYVLNDPACLDETFNVDQNFLNEPACNALIYDPQGNSLASPRQLFAMDLESGEVLQITNTDCIHIIGQMVEPTALMTMAVCADTDGSGRITESDKTEIYLLDLATGELDCLTCGHPLTRINNPSRPMMLKKAETELR